MDGVVMIGKSRQLGPQQFQNISLCYLVSFSYIKISNIYTKEGNVDLIEIDRGGWIKAGTILIRLDYLHEDWLVNWAMELLSQI